MAKAGGVGMTAASSDGAESSHANGSTASPADPPKKRRGRPPNPDGKAAQNKKRKLEREAKKREAKKARGENDDDDDDDDEGSVIAALCELCNINENDELSLICDACEKVYHTYCLNPPLPGIPSGEWVCPLCVKTIGPSKATNHDTKQSMDVSTKPSPVHTPLRASNSAGPPHFPALIPPPSSSRSLAPAAPLASLHPRSMFPQQQPLSATALGHASSSFPHAVAAHHHQERRLSTDLMALQDENVFLRRENQKLMDWVDRLTRRIDELQPLEETLRSTQFKYRKMESQMLDLQSQLAILKQQQSSNYAPSPSHRHATASSSVGALPKYSSRPYMPMTLPRMDGRAEPHQRSLEPDYRSSSGYPQLPSRRKEFAIPSVESDYARVPTHDESRRHHHPTSSRFPNAPSHSDAAYYRDQHHRSSSSLHYGSTPVTAPPPSSSSSLPYSQPPVYQKSSGNAASGYQSYPQHPSTSSSYGSSARGEKPAATVVLPPPPTYPASPARTHSFLPRPRGMDGDASSTTYVKEEEKKEPIPVYSSDEDEAGLDVRKRSHNEDDAASVLNAMRRTEASSERLNLTPTGISAISAASTEEAHSLLSITRPVEHSPSTKRIGLYTPRSRRLMLDRYLLKRTKRLSRGKWFKYPVRKTLADTRPRVKGRFVKHDLLDDDDTSSSPRKPHSPRDAVVEEEDLQAMIGDFDYIQAFAQCVKDSKDDVDVVVADILKTKQRQGELVSWDSWTMDLEQALNGLLPREYINSPFPAIFGELVYILGDAEEDCNQDNYCKALQAGASYVAICLSLYASVHDPATFDEDVSPILGHYASTIKKLWDAEPNVQKKHTFAMMKSIVDGIAGVICVGYDDGKQYLKPVSVSQLLEDGTTISEESPTS
ncbi:Aste57867_1485 [Aphanomyces stellatus]|uniref:Aste57867_1485 protein n=1 Tax=Aphanomyces stellatus TaxID=120398 RepID=A0A485K5R9_9STRA|nr:hypothetical protein As57867_001484 [Aphanomyces stellatus]VFT78701.1 Aste57867_1485 [Aphanomyces stellatus]